jgi:hypothetical protein
MAQRTPLPYWTSSGTELCERCGARYVLEMEFRCSHCDAGICDQCALVTWERREVFCAGCHAPEPTQQ